MADTAFVDPVDVRKDTEYIVAYHSPSGSFSLTPNAFERSDLSRSPLRVIPRSGSFAYGTGFPNGSSAHNYLVDPIFEPPRPSVAISSRSPRRMRSP